MHEAFPGHYFGAYPFIPVFFYLFGLAGIYVFDACRRKAPQRLPKLYLVMKVLKLLLSTLLLLLYCVAVGVEVAVLFTFLAFYLLYLIYDTWFFFSLEKKMKKKTIK